MITCLQTQSSKHYLESLADTTACGSHHHDMNQISVTCSSRLQTVYLEETAAQSRRLYVFCRIKQINISSLPFNDFVSVPISTTGPPY